MSEKKFVINKTISSEEVSYSSAEDSLRSPVARKIFGFPWTESVTVGVDFVAVAKQNWVEWEILEEPLKGLIDEHFSDLSEPIEENPRLSINNNTSQASLSSPEAKLLQRAIEAEINPALSAHGGYVNLKSYEGRVAYVEMGGGCQGCGASYMTLKEGIETTLKRVLPELREVVDVTDHAAGANPYM